MAIQTSVVVQAAGIAGQIAEASYQCRSMVNGNASAQPFGIGVTQGTGDREFDLPDASTDVFLGVLAHEYPLDNSSLSTTLGLAADMVANVLQKGVIWVLPEDDVTPASVVYWRYTVNGSDATKTPGRFGDTSDSSKNMIIANARFLDTASANTPCRLQINQP